MTLHLRGEGVAGVDFVVRFGREGIERVERAVGRVVEAVREAVDLRDVQPRLGQAVLDGAGGKFAGVFAAREPLFRGGGHRAPIHHQRGGGVVAL